MLLSIQKLEIKKIRFEESLDPGRLNWSESGLRQVSPLHAAGEAELLESTEGEVRVKGRLQVTMAADCDRCLGPAQFSLDEPFEMFYQPESAVAGSEEVAIDEGEAEIGFYRGAGIDLNEALQEQVLLSLPMHRLCGEECRGLCAICGKNRNESNCECSEVPADDRWSALKQFQISQEKVLK